MEKGALSKITLSILSKAVCIFFLLLASSFPQNNDMQFVQLTAKDGLSLNVVTQIIQDQCGFMWFGTYNGLNRFDGYNFKIFLPEPSNPKSISNHSIWALLQDNKGFIWSGTLDGLNKYNPKTEEFTRYKTNSLKENNISSNRIISIYEASDGTIWIGTSNGLNKYNRDKDDFTVYDKVSNRYNINKLNSVTCIEEDYKGNLWLGTWNGLTCMKKDGEIINQYLTDPIDSRTFDYRKISVLYEDNHHNMWVGINGNGLAKYNPDNGKFTFYRYDPNNVNSISNNYISAIYQDKLNRLWIGTKNGLNIFDPKKNIFHRILHDPRLPQSLVDNDIFSIAEDNSGLIWIGTAEGISRIYQPTNVFNYYSEYETDPSKHIVSNRVNSVLVDKKENVWIGTFNGLEKIEHDSGKIIHFRREPGNSNSLSNNNIMSLMEDKGGYIWIGTNSNGLNRYNPVTGEYKLYTYETNNNNSITNNGIISSFEDHNGTLWFGTWFGLNRFDKKTEKFYQYLSDPSNPNTLRNSSIWDILEDSEGRIWLGTDGGGASRLDPTTNAFTNFSRDSVGIHHISENRVFTIFESKNGIVWLGTSDGLSGYNLKTGKIKIYDKKNGLPGILINGILEDSEGFLWISSDKGLSKFNMLTEEFTNYSERNGLKELEFNQDVAAKAPNGNLYFGSKRGLVYFNPNKIKDEQFLAPLVFTDLKIYNQSVQISSKNNSILSESITDTKSISIPYKDNVITFEFALLDYYDVKTNNFSYILKGFDKDWTEVGNRNSATYTNLPPDEYNFVVKASNSVGVKKVQSASLNISIIPAFYQTWTFRIILVAGLLIIAVLIFQQRTRTIKKQNKILEARVNERTKDLDKTIYELSQEIVERKKAEEKVHKSLEEKEVLLKEIHHRVKNNLQVISSLLYLQSISIKDKDMLSLFEDSRNRVKSMALIHERLYQSKDFADINFGEYIKGLLDHLNSSYKNPDLLIQTIININGIKLSMDTAISCGLIVNELTTNAFKYAFPRQWTRQNENSNGYKIIVGLNKTESNTYMLSVSDNGIGISSDLKIEDTDSLGLKLVNSMVAQLNGTIEILRSNGTVFNIEFTDVA